MIIDALAPSLNILFSQIKEVLKKIYTDTALPRLISFTNRRLKEGKDWLVGNKVSEIAHCLVT